MSILDNFLRAFGFGSGGDDDDMDIRIETDDKTVGHDRDSIPVYQPDMNPDDDKTSGENVSSALSEPAVDDVESAKEGEVPVSLIFDGVVEVLNSNLPPYLKQCLDSEEQCKFIYDNLDAKLKSYLSSVAKNEAEKADKRWAAERKKLIIQVNNSAEQIANATDRASKAEEKALSADRQKRAITQRNEDLELRVARLQAEIEQYDLEKNSLLNKLRVAEVKYGMENGNTNVSEDTTAEVERLTTELESANAEIDQLKTKLQESEKALEIVGEIQKQLGEVEDMKARKNARINELKEENMRLRKELEEIRTASKSTTENEPIEFELVPQASVVEAEETTQPEVLSHVSENTPDADIVMESEQKYEPDISEVSAVIADDLDMITAISENDAMSDMAEESQQAKKKRKPRASRKPKLVAIDESISESEWLLSSSPVPPDMNNPVGFGYQEPPRRNTLPDNPAQMSLW